MLYLINCHFRKPSFSNHVVRWRLPRELELHIRLSGASTSPKRRTGFGRIAMSSNHILSVDVQQENKSRPLSGVRYTSNFATTYPTSSSRPSINCPSSAGSTTAIRLPRRSVEIVRICEILTQEGLGKNDAGRAKVSGNPAFCGWLVMAMTITVSDFRFTRSWLRITTGLNPDCSRPRTGFKSAQ